MGLGVVGGALYDALYKSPEFGGRLVTFDKDMTRTRCASGDMRECDYVFICVSTPTDVGGQSILSIIDCLSHLRVVGFEGVAIIKSTVLPSSLDALVVRFPELTILTNPEFLTANNAKDDCRNAKFHVIGAAKENSTTAEGLAGFLQHCWPGSRVVITGLKAAMMMKYAVNTSLAVKVALMNELYVLWDKIGFNDDSVWADIEELLKLDPRVGQSHIAVPGPDGKHGYGGGCFPKDMDALICEADSFGAPARLMEAAQSANRVFRREEE